MIQVAAPVKNNFGDAGRFGAVCNQSADGFGRVNVAARTAGRFVGAKAGIQRRRRGQSPPRQIINDLDIDVVAAAVDVEPGPVGRPVDALANPDVALLPRLVFVDCCHDVFEFPLGPPCHRRKQRPRYEPAAMLFLRLAAAFAARLAAFAGLAAD